MSAPKTQSVEVECEEKKVRSETPTNGETGSSAAAAAKDEKQKRSTSSPKNRRGSQQQQQQQQQHNNNKLLQATSPTPTKAKRRSTNRSIGHLDLVSVLLGGPSLRPMKPLQKRKSTSAQNIEKIKALRVSEE